MVALMMCLQGIPDGTLQVRRTQSESRVGRIEEKPKNGRGRRIELSQSVCEVLRIHCETHGGHELVCSRRRVRP